MNYVVHVGDRQDLPRVSGDAVRPVENFLVEVRAEEFFFITNNIGKTNYAFTHRNSQVGRGMNRAPVRSGRAPRLSR
jgi:hypothetical protein